MWDKGNKLEMYFEIEIETKNAVLTTKATTATKVQSPSNNIRRWALFMTQNNLRFGMIWAG